ncbi:acetyl-CoA acetyltransferase [Actinomadura sp. 7K507]|uniref:acetyl-CoA acetyltransferase n=1 Tax=Actinomadura sp. 7K507 TaxID=2530365 RepID=UPI0010434879|nr:acetyl-CoA acetyltransferase [Actinomadura sp. 7K507]TDC94571.1 thiolase [Actinomadura sp. 7K507]
MSVRSLAAIAGAGEADIAPGHGRSPLGLAAEASRRAIADAGLRKHDIDAVFVASAYHAFPALSVCEYMGLQPRYLDSSNIGGCSFIAHLAHAAAAIDAGLCEVALVTYGSTQRSDGGRLISMSEKLVFEEPYGLIHPVGSFGMIAHRHMSEFGTTGEHLAAAAVSAREWAIRNPKARFSDPITVADVLSSPMIASPLHKYDCCQVTDGGAAVIVTSAARAGHLPQHPIYVRGVAEESNHRNILAMPDLTSTRAGVSASRALRMAGLDLSDIDTAHIYDAFTISLLILLEDIGFCPKGEGGPFLADGNIAPGGTLAVNPSGGGLSHLHPGMLGLYLLLDAIEQLRGTAAERQIPGAAHSLVHGMGMTLAAHATAVLSLEP